MRKVGRQIVLVGLGVFGLSGSAGAQSAAGTYKAGPSTVQVDVSTWGDDCGTRPTSHTDNEQPKVEVRAQGEHLVLAFPDRTLRTDGCWSENPTVRPATASARDGRWRSECRTPEGEAKRERGVYSITASGSDVLELVDESDYNWQLNTSRCVAKVRTTQRLTRAGTAGTPVAAAACTPGPLARLRVRPSQPRIAPGGKVCFEVRGFDAAGCALASAPSVSFALAKASSRGSVSSNCFRAPSSGEGRFEVVASAGDVKTSAEVLVAAIDLSDITARHGEQGGTPDADEEAGESNTSVFGIDASVADSPLALALTVCALLLALAAIAGFVLLRRAQKGSAGRDSRITPMPTPPPRKRTTGSGGQPLICPACRQGYPPGTARCPKDGEKPIAYAAFLAEKMSAPRPTCPQCGAQLAPGATFCGSCGTRVER